MSGLGDIQSLLAISFFGGKGLSMAKAGVMGALSKGANVVHKGANSVAGGVSNISSMLNKSKTLTDNQMKVIKESIQNNNSYKAQHQVQDFISENSKGKYSSNNSVPINNQFNQTYNAQYNPLKDKFTNPNDRKWN